MTRKIPTAIIAVASDVLANRYSHAMIDQMMEAAGLEMDPPPAGNKQVKTRAWLNHANNASADALSTLGQVIAAFMEKDSDEWDRNLYNEQDRVKVILGKYGMSYAQGGYIHIVGETKVGKTLRDIIRNHDLSGLQTEFDRIYENLESDPAAAITASCALLESLFKTYIQDNNLEMPSDESVRPLWKAVRKDLKLDPAIVSDDDLKTILGGLANIVEGTGSLRTHKGSAHGHGRTTYKLKPRHARLAAHAAFTLASYVMEAWAERGA